MSPGPTREHLERFHAAESGRDLTAVNAWLRIVAAVKVPYI